MSGHPHRLNDLEDGGADDYEDEEGLAMMSFSHERNDYKKAKSRAWWKTILMQLYLYTYNKFGADRVLVIVLAGSFHLDVYWLFVFWASDCSYFGQKMTPIVPNIFCFATNNSTLTLKPRVKIKDHPTWPLLVTFLAFFSFAFLICGVDGIWNIKWSIQVDILLPFTANNHFP